MMKYLRRFTQGQIIVLATLLVGIICFLIIAGKMWSAAAGYHQQSRDLIPRIARLAGLAESESILQLASEQVHAEVTQLVYAQDIDAGAALQQQVRRVVERAGLTVSGSQILNPRIENLYSRIPLEVNATGSLEALEAALVELRDLKPIILVDSLQMQPVRARVRRGSTSAPEQALTIRFRVSGFKVQP